MDPRLKMLLFGGGAVAAVYFLFIKRTAAQVKEDNSLGFTEETGIVGDVGATTNRLSGGRLAQFGQFIGGRLADVADVFRGTTGK